MKKKLNKSFALLLVPFLLLSSCGEKGKEEAKDEKPAEKVDAELEKQIDALAACKEQNTNCEAYTTTGDYIEALCADEKKREAVVHDLVIMIDRGPGKKSQAAAHALNFWTSSYTFRDNAEYGKIVLNALLKEKDEEGNYTGSQLGQLLAGWLANPDKDLQKSLIAAMKSKKTEMRGRMELIRLCPTESLSNPEIFSALTGIINDATETKEVRVTCLNVIWRVENEDQKATVRSIYENNLNDPDTYVAGTAMTGLGYLKSFASYDLIEQTLLAQKDNADWCYYGSSCLGELARTVPDSLDMNKVLALVKTLISNKAVVAYNRSYYVSTLMAMNTAGSKSLLAQLKSSGEKEIVDEITRMAKYAK